MSLASELRSRFKPEYAQLGAIKPLVKAFNEALDARARIEAKQNELRANRDLSDEGKAKALKAAAAVEAPHVAKAMRGLRVAIGKTHQQRVALTPTVSDKANLADAVKRMEIRSVLRGMAPASIAAIANDPSTDTVTLEALFDAPGFLTGIDSTMREHLLKMVLERTSAPALAALDDQAEALNVVSAAIQAASQTLHGAAGLGNAPDAFDKWLTQVAPATAEDIASEQSVYRKDAVVIDALSLSAAQRSSLIDELLRANTAELTTA